LRKHRIPYWLLNGIVTLGLLAWLAPQGASQDRRLPAQNWNPDNLARITAKADPVTFAVLGDSRDNRGVFALELRHINADPDIAFAIHLGDLVHNVESDYYDIFFRQVRENLHKPMPVVIGNHELQGQDAPRLYTQIFGPDHYSFQIKDHYFIAFNDADKTLQEDQLRWLTEELKKSQSFHTRLVFLHIPLFDPPGFVHHHALPAKEARILADLFKQYKVTHVFTGHLHGYFSGDWEGIPYTITGGAGVSLSGTDPRQYFFHYLKVTLRGDQVAIEVQRFPGPGAERRKPREAGRALTPQAAGGPN
jgi:3',5'-cyclic AMP phosphodiesterase CpdA